ncbi:BatA domain-containing protein [Pedobacter arcticus]|uniref:BatA domain-containing protein n=1 Tax=Pedobacter arcticus TaxID=752140 RepID=UPI0002FB4FB7|nr:BatA domain-containing protein [Pedobacter arcticus]
MGFLFPEFLFCLVLVAIPVIIHLFNFKRFKKVYFTNINFLTAVQLQTATAKNLKECLVLLCRILAIVFFVLAFAQPFIKNNQQQQGFQKNVVSIYLDNSFSMAAVNKNGTLLDEGKRKVKDLVNAYGLNDRFQLLTNNFGAASQRLLAKDELLDELDNVTVEPLSSSYQQIINKQADFLNAQQQVNRTAYLISDFQKQPNFKQVLQKDTAISFTLVPLLSNNLPNISVDSVYFLNPFHQAQQSESLVYKLSNHFDKDVENISLSLKINGVQKAIGNSSIKANSYVLDTLLFSGLTGNWQKATLSIKDYPITFDDELNFVFKIQDHSNITAIYDGKPVKSIGVAYRTDPFFKLSEIDQAQLNYSSLASQQLVVLENLTQVPAGLAQQLKIYVKNGGNLSVFIPLKADLLSYKAFLQGLETDIPLSLETTENKVAKLNLAHPLFKDLFDQYPKNIDLPIAKQFFKASNFTKTTRQLLFSGTASNNLLSAYQLGKGKIYISFLPLENEASNFSQHALFLPILFKSALVGFNSPALFYTLGDVKNVSMPSIPLAENQNIKIVGNGVDVIPSYQNNGLNSSIYFADQLKKPGFYDVFYRDSIVNIFALNQSRAESDLSFYSQTELESKFQIPAKSIISSKEKITDQQIKEVNLGTSLWKLCLILTLIFLAAEILLIRFYKKPVLNQKEKI